MGSYHGLLLTASVPKGRRRDQVVLEHAVGRVDEPVLAGQLSAVPARG